MSNFSVACCLVPFLMHTWLFFMLTGLSLYAPGFSLQDDFSVCQPPHPSSHFLCKAAAAT